jgi:hypothetical protein
MTEITPDPKEIRQKASEAAFGFRLGSTSLKVVHFGNVLFNHVLDSAADTTELGQFVYNINLDADELEDELEDDDPLQDYNIRDYFDPIPNDDEIRNIARFMRVVLHNDEGMYADPNNMAPNATSEWSVGKMYGATRLGRYIFELANRADEDHDANIVSNLETGLTDHEDGVSVLVRPIMHESGTLSVSSTRWDGPSDDPFDQDTISNTLIEGFARLNRHFHGYRAGSPDHLVRIVKFGTLAMYLYIANRFQEISPESGHDYPVPIVLNYTGSETQDNPMLQASFRCYNRILSEVRQATRIGIQWVLDGTPIADWDDDTITEKIEARELPELENRSADRYEADFEQFARTYESAGHDTPLKNLVDAFSSAIELEQFASDVYPPWKTERIVGRRLGFTKPMGRNANEYWFRPDPELLEVIVLSTIKRDEEIEITEFRRRLRERYGIIVGGLAEDRRHLDNWGIKMGSEIDPGNSPEENAERFLDALIGLGYAERYADGVAMVRSQEFGGI